MLVEVFFSFEFGFLQLFFYTFFFSPSEALTSIAWSVAILRILDAELFMNAKALWH